MTDDIASSLDSLCLHLQMVVERWGKAWSNRKPAVEVIAQEASRKLTWIGRRLEPQRYKVAFVGLTNAGKSTLLNGLFAEDIVPKYNGACTSSPVEFVGGQHYSFSVEYRDTSRRISEQVAGPDELRQKLTNFATAQGQSSISTIKLVTVTIPCPLVSKDLVVVDTPGFGAAQSTRKEGDHEDNLLDYLPESQQIFWVVGAQGGKIALEAKEVDFFRQHLKDSCDDIVVTGSDCLSADQRRQFQKFNQEKLGLQFLAFHFVSGKQAFKGKRDGDAQLVKLSGIDALEGRLQSMAHRNQRAHQLKQDLVQLLSDLGYWSQKNFERKEFKSIWGCASVEMANMYQFLESSHPTLLDSRLGTSAGIEKLLYGQN